MKKLLTLMSVSILGSSLASSVVSCGATKPVPRLDDPDTSLTAYGTKKDTHKFIKDGKPTSDPRYNDISTWSTATMANPDYMAAFESTPFVTGAGADVTASLESTTASSYTELLTKDAYSKDSSGNVVAETPYWLLANYEIYKANEDTLDNVFGIKGMPNPNDKNTPVAKIAPYFTKVYNRLIRDFNITIWSGENQTVDQKTKKVTAQWYNSTNYNVEFKKDDKNHTISKVDGWTTNKDIISETSSSSKDDGKTDVTEYTVTSYISVEPRFDNTVNVAAVDGFIGGRVDYVVGKKEDIFNTPQRNDLVSLYSDKNTIGESKVDTTEMIVSLYNPNDARHSNAFVAVTPKGMTKQVLQFKPGKKGAQSFDYRYKIQFSWTINATG